MRKVRGFLLLLLCITGSVDAAPDFRVSMDAGRPGRGAENSAAGQPPVRSMIQAPVMNRQQAASLVKQSCHGCRILSVAPVAGRPEMFRVKTLSAEGVLKTVTVDGQSGAVY
ncbi:MAG: hypothetical protein OEZ23_00930 [Gammaproteobacteria bacterium]|nr:hypothetical protein [Gammaproteobacteria bacterium]